MFDGGGLVDGLETIRTPLCSEPQQMPERPSACEIDAVWHLLCACLRAEPDARPSFAEVAVGMSEAQQAAAGASGWL